jgi:hypothetical protein
MVNNRIEGWETLILIYYNEQCTVLLFVCSTISLSSNSWENSVGVVLKGVIIFIHGSFFKKVDTVPEHLYIQNVPTLGNH